MEWLSSLFNNTLGSNGIGGGLAKMFSAGVDLPAGNIVDPSTLSSVTQSAADTAGDTFGALGVKAPAFGNLYNGSVSTYTPNTSGGGLAGMMGTIKGYMPGDDTLKMLGTGGKMYSDIMSGINQGKAQDLLRNQYNRDTARLAKADADVERQREQSNRVWGGGL